MGWGNALIRSGKESEGKEGEEISCTAICPAVLEGVCVCVCMVTREEKSVLGGDLILCG